MSPGTAVDPGGHAVRPIAAWAGRVRYTETLVVPPLSTIERTMERA